MRVERASRCKIDFDVKLHICIIASYKQKFLSLLNKVTKLVGWLVVRVRPIFLMWDVGLWGEYPRWGSFEGIPARIYMSFGENHGKLRTARLTSATGV